MFAYNEKWIKNIKLSIKTKSSCALILLVSTQASVLAGELQVNAGVDLEIVDQQIKTKEVPIQEINAINRLVKPYASVLYKAKDLDIFLKGTNNHISRKLDNETISQNFTEYQYSGNYSIVEDVLSFRTTGAKRYMTSSLNSFLVDDFLLNGDSLNEITSNSSTLMLNIRRGEYYGLSATSSYSSANSDLVEQNLANNFTFDSERYSISLNAITGEGLEGARINLSGNYQYSKQGNDQDYISKLVTIAPEIDVYDDFGIVLNGTYENNEIKTDFEVQNNGLREFYSVGAGLIWQPKVTRKLEVLWNKSYTASELEGVEDETDNYLSYNLDWAFSDRTSIQATFNRRFFGEAGNLAFRHRTRNSSSSINYSEIVTSTSQLTNTTGVGLFICDSGSNNIADCRLSDTLEPVLGTGEVLQPLLVQNFGLNDFIILRKSLVAQSAITRRRTTLSLTGVKAEDQEVESGRIYDSISVSSGLAFALSRNANISYDFRFSKVELDQEGTLEGAITKVHTLELSRKLSRRFETALSISYLDRNGDITRGDATISEITGPLTDRRVTFRISYSLGIQ